MRGFASGCAAAVVLLFGVPFAVVVIGDEQADGAPQEARVISAIGDQPAKSTADHLACTPADSPANFRLYSLGASFEGLPLTKVLRQCENPGLDASLGIDARGNSVSYIYGDCEPPLGEGGCAPPLEVQVWPACERSLADYDIELPPPVTELRGAPMVEIGDRVEVYSDSTVVLFSPDVAVARRAAVALQPVRVDSTPATLPPEIEKLSQLPPPADGSVSGELRCAS